MLHDPYEKNVDEIKDELNRLEARIELIQSLDKYDEIIEGCLSNDAEFSTFNEVKDLLQNARDKFYAWQERYVERI